MREDRQEKCQKVADAIFGTIARIPPLYAIVVLLAICEGPPYPDDKLSKSVIAWIVFDVALLVALGVVGVVWYVKGY